MTRCFCSSVGLVLGGGNLVRGSGFAELGDDRVIGDQMGMLATIMNALAMQNSLERLGVQTRVQSAITMTSVCEPYTRRRAIRHMEKERVVIFAAGTGNPYFTTDTAAALRASEMACEALFKGTKVDGVYNKDPQKFDDAEKYKTISFQDVLTQNLKVLDASAISLARDNDIPVIVFSINEKDAFLKVLNGDNEASTTIYDLLRKKLTEILNLDDLKRRMEGALNAFSQDLAGLRTGRASANMIDQITVDAYGSKMPIEQVGTISIPEPRTISIQVWDKGLVISVEKSIQESGLGLNPQTDGQLVRIPVPELNEERRQELIKIAGKYSEQSRVSIRNIRRDGMDIIKACLLYTSPSPRDATLSRMPSSA